MTIFINSTLWYKLFLLLAQTRVARVRKIMIFTKIHFIHDEQSISSAVRLIDIDIKK